MANVPPHRLRVPPEVAAALARGAEVLSGSMRAARALSRAYAEDAQAEGRGSWQAPAIRDWDSWVEQLYTSLLQDGSELPSVLQPLQEELLWTRVQKAEASAVVSPQRLARLAQSGYALLNAYEAHAGRRAPWAAAHEDAERFLGWAEAFDALCEELRVLSRSGLDAALRRDAARLMNERQVSPELLLVGFDRLTPAQTALCGALRNAGVQIAEAPPGESAAQRSIVSAANEQEELRACASWVREQLTEDPKRRIGVLLPELGAARAEVDRVFRRVLLPEGAARPAPGRMPYEFSLGTPLAEIPLIASALPLLRWLGGPLAAAEITSLLLGGFLAGSEGEALALAQSDAALRRGGLLTSELSLGTLLRHVGRKPELLPAGLAERLRAAEAAMRRETRRRPYSDWAEAVPALLETAGWPGFRELGSLPFQARGRWDNLLGEIALLGFAGDGVSWSEFVAELSEAAGNTLFAPESRNAPVQILGVTEAAGLRFDAVWFLGMTEAQWPKTGRVHPLLAPGLQRDFAMPHASPDADTELARKQILRVLASAPVVVASYALQSRGAEARPSPLLCEFAAASTIATTSAELPAGRCETVSEPDTIVVAPWPAPRVAGGSEVLKRQAACGFQSFATKRLGAEALDEEAWGLDAGERATLLHRALEQLWSTEPQGGNRLHTLDDLQRAIDEGRLEDLVQAAIASSFEGAMRGAAGDPWRTAYLELEQGRLCTRLLWWLNVEQHRLPFRVVALEQRIEDAPVGELRLNLRLDRVDELSDGSKLLLDYKTAERVNTGLWMGERPDEPQLPIYALFAGLDDVSGVAFAQIRAGKTRLISLAENPVVQSEEPPPKDSDPSETPPFWDETLTAWDHALRALAGQFARGEAPVNPKYGAQTCRLCGLYGVCRVRSLGGASLIVEGEDDA